MKKVLTTAIVLWLFTFACTTDELSSPLDYSLKKALNTASETGSYDYFILPESDDFTNIPQDQNNPLTKQKVELGKMLFYETGLALAPMHESSKGTYSCSTCHVPNSGFMPGRLQGIADGGIGFGDNGEERTKAFHYDDEELDVQSARPLSLMNVAFVTNTSWNGQFGANDQNIGTEGLWDDSPLTEVNHLGFMGLESQNIEGLALHRMVINKNITDSLGYTAMYNAAFPDFEPEERYSEITTSFAISAYLRTIFANEAPFQKWLKGDDKAMTEKEKRGGNLFFGKAKCASCHGGPALNANRFYAVGVKDLYQTSGSFNTGPDDKRNMGRGGFTKKQEDMHKFKVPQLYNLKASPFYFHGSSKHSIQEVIEYFNAGIPENSTVPEEQLAPQFQPLNLSDEEISDLISFVAHSLYDADIERYVPYQVLSGNCFPNNDAASRSDLGCD